jgi:mannose-1-phosphate guanylyltransferase
MKDVDGGALWCVVMAGGAGTRFWPASTEARPKQLLTLVGDRSLLQLSVDRARALVPAERVLVITNAALADACREQLPELPTGNVVAEPMRRDTAAAVALATAIVAARTSSSPGPSASGPAAPRVAVLTADHLISPVEAFTAAVRAAVVATSAEPRSIVTFGVVPSYPATGYGYLEVDSLTGDDARPVRRFVEKPDLATATSYLQSGRFLWNSGMFVFAVEAMLGALDAHLPAHLPALRPAIDGAGIVDAAVLADAFARVPKISIDKGVMEKHDDVRCVPARFAWSDVGSFPALAEHLPKDAHENAYRGVPRTLDARGNVLWAEDASEEIAVVGLSDVVVVRAGKRTLVVPRARAEDVKKLVEGT